MQKLVLLAIAVIAVYCAFSICHKSNDYTVEHIKKVMGVKRKVRLWTLLGGILCFVILFAASNVQNSVSGTGLITLNYSEASKAQNANKTRFSMTEILSDDVLDRTIEKGGFEGVTREGLKKALAVTPTVQGYSYEKESYHISTEFRLTYKANKETRGLEPATVIQLAADSFKEIFIEKYARNYSLLVFKPEEANQFEGMDYYDIAYYLSMRADNISAYMSELNGESPSFKTEDGTGFASLSAKSGNIRKEQLDNDLLAYIRDKGVSKNKTRMLKRLSFNNNMMGFDLQKANSSFEINNQAIAMYAAEMTRIALVPTIDEGKDYYMSQTKVGLDDLSMAAKGASEEAGGLLTKIKRNSAFAESLRANPHTMGSDPVLDKEIEKICDSLVQISKDARYAAQAYTETRMNGVISAQVAHPSPVQTGAACFVTALLFFGALYMLSATQDYTEGRTGA
ncbi:MAG: hypothetical protein J5758_02410 [Abditibacteriota bacterium]|nr:hypothetical protein [Abditibacteriota bacterium]